ncbi:MAG: (2Fe-2S)-binding protein [Actinomycetota bacterium]
MSEIVNDAGETVEPTHTVELTVNGQPVTIDVPGRRLLSDALRVELGLTGTHVGCEHGVCGCCTVLVDDLPMRSCLLFAVAADGRHIRTVEGLAAPGPVAGASSPGEPSLHPIQEAFRECHGLQCGFCTPGFLMTTTALLERHPDPTDDQITEALAGNLCRCTGYQNIETAVRLAADRLRADDPAGSGADR